MGLGLFRPSSIYHETQALIKTTSARCNGIVRKILGRPRPPPPSAKPTTAANSTTSQESTTPRVDEHLDLPEQGLYGLEGSFAPLLLQGILRGSRLATCYSSLQTGAVHQFWVWGWPSIQPFSELLSKHSRSVLAVRTVNHAPGTLFQPSKCCHLPHRSKIRPPKPEPVERHDNVIRLCRATEPNN